MLRTLLSDSRIKRMSEHLQRSEDQAKVYSSMQLMEDLRNGIMSELQDKKPAIDLYRRNLQRAYVDLLATQVKSNTADSDLPALARAELTKVLTMVNGKYPTGDALTDAHLKQLSVSIETAFDTRVVETSSAPAATPSFPRRRGGQ